MLQISTGKIKLEIYTFYFFISLQWHLNEPDDVSNHQPRNCLLNCLITHRSKKTSKLRVTGLCAGNSLVTSEFPAQMASNAEYVSIWWRHHDPRANEFIHWWRVTHICFSKLNIIGSNNGLSPGRCQAIIWTNAGILLIRPLGTNFSEILNKIDTFHSRKCCLRNVGHFVSTSMC